MIKTLAGRSRLYRFGRIVALVTACVVVVASLYIRLDQWRFRHRMERLLEDVRGLEVGKATAADARRVAQKWDFGEVMLKGTCSDSVCDYGLQRPNPVASVLEYFGYKRVAKRILILLGGRPVLVTSFVGVRSGTVWAKDFSLLISAPGPNDQGMVMGSAGTAGRYASGGSNRERPTKLLAGSLRHEDYLVGRYTATTNLDYGTKERVPTIWVEFSQDADVKTVNRLMRLNLSCITRLRSCGQAEMMPEVWSEIGRDEQSPSGAFTCTSALVKRVARLADAIAVVRVDSPELQPPPNPNSPFRMYDVSMLRLVKGPDHLRRTLGGWIEVDDPKIAVVADDGAKLRASEQYIFLLQDHTYGGFATVALYPCGVLTMNDANLEMVQEVAAKSVE